MLLKAGCAAWLRHILLGPVVWAIKPGSDQRHWYFVVASGSPEGCRLDQLGHQSREEIEQLRRSVQLRLWQGKPLVVHDFDDELELAKWCEELWPSIKTSKIRADTEADRAGA